MDKIINWMGGWPKEGFVSASDWEEKLAGAADRYRLEGPMEAGSIEELKTMLARSLLKRKTGTRAARMRLMPGADAALSRLTETSLAKGDIVLTERIASRFALQLFHKAGIRVEAVDGDGEGMDPDSLRKAMRKFRPRLVYASPVCSDPQGVIWPRERREAVAQACREEGVCLVRDDRQEMLVYEDGKDSQDPAQAGVLSIGQLPPGLVAGLRFGWAAGYSKDLAKWFPAVSVAGGTTDEGVPPLTQRALLDLLKEQPLEPWMDMLRVQCRERMRRLTGLLKLKKSAWDLHWREPSGGVHLWLRLPDGLDAEALLRGAWIKGLMFQPGAAFYAARPERNTLRLTFAFADDRQLQAGAARLFDTIEDFLGRYEIH